MQIYFTDLILQAVMDNEFSDLQISVEQKDSKTDLDPADVKNYNTPGLGTNLYMAAKCDFTVGMAGDMAPRVDFSYQGQIQAAVHVQSTQACTSLSQTALSIPRSQGRVVNPSANSVSVPVMDTSMTFPGIYVSDDDDLSQCNPASFLSLQYNFV